jgi:outer membrane biosynthesis protein TonB
VEPFREEKTERRRDMLQFPKSPPPKTPVTLPPRKAPPPLPPRKAPAPKVEEEDEEPIDTEGVEPVTPRRRTTTGGLKSNIRPGPVSQAVHAALSGTPATRYLNRVCQERGLHFALVETEYDGANQDRRVLLVGRIIEGNGPTREEAIMDIARHIEQNGI